MRLALSAAVIALAVTVPVAAQDAAMASLSEAQIKDFIVGDWTLAVGFGAGPMSISDLQGGALSVTGKMILNYSTLTVSRGRLDGDKVTLNFPAGSLQGVLTNPRHMEGDILFRGDNSGGPVPTWFADKVGR